MGLSRLAMKGQEQVAHKPLIGPMAGLAVVHTTVEVHGVGRQVHLLCSRKQAAEPWPQPKEERCGLSCANCYPCLTTRRKTKELVCLFPCRIPTLAVSSPTKAHPRRS
jgi:hypothetical protein